ncbi:MAG: hypothetical protein H0W88_00720 [Parachlamydiaceae bacterium]|nr:hypothetical protein [Parachlamydiaceae bacterium]
MQYISICPQLIDITLKLNDTYHDGVEISENFKKILSGKKLDSKEKAHLCCKIFIVANNSINIVAEVVDLTNVFKGNTSSLRIRTISATSSACSSVGKQTLNILKGKVDFFCILGTTSEVVRMQGVITQNYYIETVGKYLKTISDIPSNYARAVELYKAAKEYQETAMEKFTSYRHSLRSLKFDEELNKKFKMIPKKSYSHFPDKCTITRRPIRFPVVFIDTPTIVFEKDVVILEMGHYQKEKENEIDLLATYSALRNTENEEMTEENLNAWEEILIKIKTLKTALNRKPHQSIKEKMDKGLTICSLRVKDNLLKKIEKKLAELSV